jgi:translation initiation factor 6 (eIF-6)
VLMRLSEHSCFLRIRGNKDLIRKADAVLSIRMVDLTCAGSSKNPCLLGSVNQRGLLLKPWQFEI